MKLKKALKRIAGLESQVRRMYIVNRQSDKRCTELGIDNTRIEQKLISAELLIGKLTMAIQYSDGTVSYPKPNGPFMNISPIGTVQPSFHNPWYNDDGEEILDIPLDAIWGYEKTTPDGAETYTYHLCGLQTGSAS